MTEPQIGKYQVLEEIASGAQGAVFRAFDPSTGSIVALKVLHSSLTSDSAYVERFRREAALAASIDHPNVIKIFEVSEDRGKHFMAMEFLPESLGRVMDASGQLPIEGAARFAYQIASGLAAAHAQGVVHRDIKPQNVLIGPDGGAKVTDFGIARGEMLATMTATGVMMGTPYYMSPEQARGERADSRSDIYSLGCVLFQMLAGDVPFSAPTPLAVLRMHTDLPPPALRKLRSDIPRAIVAVVDRALAKNPAARFQSASDLCAALASALPGAILSPASAEPPPASPPPAFPPRQQPPPPSGPHRPSGAPDATPEGPPPPRRGSGPRSLIAFVLGAVVIGAVAIGALLILNNRPSDEPPGPVATVATATAAAAATATATATATTIPTPPATQTAAPEDTAAATATEEIATPADAPTLPPPSGALDTKKNYSATIKTNRGDIVVELFDDDAPLTVENFINLARSGFYDDNPFHRVIADFIVQTGAGVDGAGVAYQIEDELSPKRRHDGPGVLSMANVGQPNSGSSQFFITHVATFHLDGYNPDGTAKNCRATTVSCHTVFGKVLQGQNVVDAIVEGDKIITIAIAEAIAAATPTPLPAPTATSVPRPATPTAIPAATAVPVPAGPTGTPRPAPTALPVPTATPVPLYLRFDGKTNVPGVPEGIVPYLFTVLGANLAALSDQDRQRLITSPPGSGAGFLLDQPDAIVIYMGAETPAGRYTVAIALPDRRTAQAGFEHTRTPVNDDVANAFVIEGLPFGQKVNLSDATIERKAGGADEELPCTLSGDDVRGTVWYLYTPSAITRVNPTIDAPEVASIGAYEGPSFTEVECTRGVGSITFGAPLTLQAGRTYLFQVGGAGPIAFELFEVAPTPAAAPSPTPTPTPTSTPTSATAVWRLTGSMDGPRRDHAAVLLDVGTVLIAGGTSSNAELYDPATGAFTSLGILPFRQGVRATRLANGTALVLGEYLGTTAMIYDPSSRQFTPTGRLNKARSYSSVTLLPDGTVLVAGGQEQVEGMGPQSLSVAEVYDPATGIFTLTGRLNEHRSGHAAVLLPSGDVLIVGGTQTYKPAFGITLSAAELYDTETGTFSLIGSTISSHSSLSSGGVILLPSGKVLIAGGAGNKAELFDPVTGTFSATGDMTTTRSSHSSTLLPNGQVLLAGGSTAGGPVVTSSAELFDPVAGTFSPITSMNEPRQQHTATLLPNGDVLIIGGFGGERNQTADGSSFEINQSSAELWISSRLAPEVGPTPTPTPTSTPPAPTPVPAIITVSAGTPLSGSISAEVCLQGAQAKSSRAGDLLAANVDWGDGSGFVPVLLIQASNEIIACHQYAKPGEFGVRVRVSNDTGNSAEHSMLAAIVAITGTSTSTPTAATASTPPT